MHRNLSRYPMKNKTRRSVVYIRHPRLVLQIKIKTALPEIIATFAWMSLVFLDYRSDSLAKKEFADRLSKFSRQATVHRNGSQFALSLKVPPSTFYIQDRYAPHLRFFRSTFHKSAHVDPHLAENRRLGARCIVTSVAARIIGTLWVRATATQSCVPTYLTNFESDLSSVNLENLLNDISKVNIHD